MRTTKSLWLTLACVLAAALVSVGKAAAAPKKRISVQVRQHTSRGAQVLGDRAAAIARRMIGTPYAWGGSSPGGFDCSGLVMFTYGRLGVKLPHSSYALFDMGRRIGRWALKPGDLVFFYGEGHVGIYIGHGKFIHAPHAGERVHISTLKSYAGAFDGARRLAAAARPS